MLLRRVTEHVKAQNWFAVGIDLTVVVFGVYIGMQAGDWQQHAQDREEEIEYLQRILEDLDESIRLQEYSDDFQQTSVDEIDWIISILDAGEIPPNKEVELGKQLYEIGRTNPLRYRFAAAEEMIATGKLGLIQDTKLRSAVGSLPDVARQTQALAYKPDRQNDRFIGHIFKYVGRKPLADGEFVYEYDPDRILHDPELRNAILVVRNMTAAVRSFSVLFTGILVETREEVRNALHHLTGDKEPNT